MALFRMQKPDNPLRSRWGICYDEDNDDGDDVDDDDEDCDNEDYDNDDTVAVEYTTISLRFFCILLSVTIKRILTRLWWQIGKLEKTTAKFVLIIVATGY